MKTRTISLLGILGFTLALGACAFEPQDAEQTEQAAKKKIFCGGIAGIQCPDGLECVDDPSDGCDPARGGADCGGMCVRPRGGGNRCEHKRSQYLAYGEQCDVIRFFCQPGEQAFWDNCGCGCEPAPGEECNQTTCGAGEFCCNYSCSICAPEGGFCTEQFCM